MIASNPHPESVRAARRSAGMTQAEAGELVYRTERNWQQWEGGERAMDPALWELFILKVNKLNRQKKLKAKREGGCGGGI